MRPSHGCSRLKAFRIYSLSSSTIRLASKRRIQVRVLLVDDDAAIARSIELMLKIEEINVYRTDLGEEGVDLGKIYDYDIILLDLNLPDISGYEVLRSLRSAKVVTPVLILSGLASIEDKIRGLGLGADDYLAKPFHKDELIARIHALVRRSKGHAQSLIAVGDLIQPRGPKCGTPRPETAPYGQGVPNPRTPGTPHRLNVDQGNVPQPSLRRMGRRAGSQDHRRLHMQAQKEAR
jgi:CheY-like chemotaxis protein